MKKYFFTMAVMAIFAIGFAASDEEESASTESSSPQTEVKQESEADRQAREREKEAKEKKKEEEKMLEYARWCGEQQCTMTYPIEAKKWYIGRWGTPSTEEDFKKFEKFKAEYERALEKGREAARRMDNM